MEVIIVDFEDVHMLSFLSYLSVLRRCRALILTHQTACILPRWTVACTSSTVDLDIIQVALDRIYHGLEALKTFLDLVD